MSEILQVLWYSDTPTCATGFGQVAKNLLKALHATGKYHFDVIGINHGGHPYSHVEFPFSVEAKCSEGLNLLETYNQVLSNVVKGTDWMIVHQRKSIPETLCIISWDTFKKLFKKEIV